MSLLTVDNESKTINFIEKANKKHSDKFVYSKTEYVNARTKVTIICPTHGEFQQTPNNHLRTHGCPDCEKRKRSWTTQEFIEKANKKHSDKFVYSKTEYVNYITKVTIICPTHGEFQQTPVNHLRGKGCLDCMKRRRREALTSTTQNFIEKASKKHSDKFVYSKTEYVNSRTKVTIICPTHGEFQQIPNNHLMGKGCPDCGKRRRRESLTSTTQNFIEKANKKHSDKFVYSKTEYVNDRTKVTIICPTHGEFQQTPNKHLMGRGCPDCVNKTEGVVLDFLLNNKSNFEIKTQYKPDWCKNPDTGKHLPYDFYIELSNGKKIIIECDGRQHYEENSHFHRNGWTLEKQQDRDIFKMNKANENDVSVIRIHQEDVYNDRINWKKEITDAIDELKNEDEVSVKVLGRLKKDTDKLCWEFD